MVFPEELEELIQVYDVWVIHDEDRFGVTGHPGAGLFIGRVRSGATGVDGCGGVHALLFPEEPLSAPEATHAKQNGLHAVGERADKRVAVHVVR